MPLKIVHISTVDLSIRYLILDLLKYLQQRGYDVRGICAPGDLIAQIEAAGVHVITVPMTRRITPGRDVIALIRLIGVLRRERPTIVHTCTPKANLLGQWAAWLARVPLRVGSVLGFLFTEETTAMKRAVFILIERLSFLNCQTVFYLTDGFRELATQTGMVPARKAVSLKRGMGTDTRRFAPSPDPSSATAFRREWRIPADAFVVGFIGRLVREKGLIELFQAIAAVRQRVPNVWLLVVGPSDVEKSDAVDPGVAAAYGIADISTFTGSQSDTVAMYRMMDIFALPTYREGVPWVNVEAQSMGLPIVTTNIPGTKPTLEPGRTGFVVPVKDAEALAAAILRLATDPALCRQMGEAARERAVAQLDQRITFAQIEEEYSRLLRELSVDLPIRGSSATDSKDASGLT